MLLVNVASQCECTPQYKELEKRSGQYKKNLIDIGFPSNDIMGQRPGSSEEIKIFCSVPYGVTFPLSQKLSTVRPQQSGLYHWLTDSSLIGGDEKSPKCNFYKYLLSPYGALTQVFSSTTIPMSETLTSVIQ